MELIRRARFPKSEIGTLFSNSAFLIINDVITRASIFVLYALVARYLGAYQFGQLSLALTILFTFQILAPAGLRLLIVREVANDRQKTELYLVNGSIIAIFFSFLSYLILLLGIAVLDYSADTASAIFLVSLGLLPYSLSAICEGVFQGWERMQFITAANFPRNLLVVVLAGLMLSQGHGLDAIAWLLSISFLFTLVIELWLILRFICKPRFMVDLEFAVQTTKMSMTFLGFQGTLAVANTMILIMLSKSSGETAVGYYNAAGQVMLPLMLIIQSVVISAFPLMCRRFEVDMQGLKSLSNNLIILLLLITIPFVIGLMFLAEDILVLFYGNQDFVFAAVVLRLMSFTLILRALSAVLGRDLLAIRREKDVLRIVLMSSVVYLFSGYMLIQNFDLLGAALTAIIFSFIDFVLHYLYTRRAIGSPIPWLGLWQPVLATAAMAGFLVTVRIPNDFMAVFLAGMIYLCMWLVLEIWSSGGLSQARRKYRILWSE